MIWDLNVAVLYGRFLSYRGGLYNSFDCIYILYSLVDSSNKQGIKINVLDLSTQRGSALCLSFHEISTHSSFTVQ